MSGRLLVLAGFVGVLLAHMQGELPGIAVLVLQGVFMSVFLACACAMRRRYGFVFGLALLLLAAWLAYAFASVWAQARLAQELAAGNVDKVSRVVLRIEGLPQLQADRVRFEALVLQSHPEGVPQRIVVNWPSGTWSGPYAAPVPADPPFPELRAGQVWRMALVLRPIRAAQNMHAFDYEAHAFAAGIRARGTVRGTPEHLHDEDWASLPVVAGRARHAVREAMEPYLQGRRYGPVLRALAIGDQDGVDEADWAVFNRTGITHLVSISGSHITMLAALGALAAYHLWRRLSWRGRILAERWPARRAAALAALMVAWLYCLLAGWGVPARRTFMMLAVLAGSQALQLRLSGSRVLALAAVAVIAMDPWAVLSSGFHLSFAAVAVLLAVGAQAENRLKQSRDTGPGIMLTGSRTRKFLRGLGLAAHLQLAVSFALAPVLAWLFHEVSLVSPLANAYAIPAIELFITPLSLLLALVAFLPGAEAAAGALAWLAHGLLELMMRPTEWLALLPVVMVPAGPPWLYLLAAGGAMVALWPGSRWRRLRIWAWLAMLPMAFWMPDRPGHGEWQLHALDIGQGSALILQTSDHAFLFDAGPRHARDADEGARTIVPALRALGIRRLDMVFISHADLDHAGGVRSVLAAVPVEQAYSSFDLEAWLQAESRKLDAGPARLPLAAVPCVFGTYWQVDGVSFEFLWPLDVQADRPGAAANDGSCVLRVRGAHHSLLFTGDIERSSEAALIDRGLAPVDVVVAAHHGSRTSSSAAFVRASSPAHVIIQAGHWNRYGHPAAEVLQRWRAGGATIWRTDRHGGVNAISRRGRLSLYSIRESSRRYWHERWP